MAELRGLVGGFLVTFVEREGRMGGTALSRVPELVEAAGDARVTIAGGVSSSDELAALDAMGAAQSAIRRPHRQLRPLERPGPLRCGIARRAHWPHGLGAPYRESARAYQAVV